MSSDNTIKNPPKPSIEPPRYTQIVVQKLQDKRVNKHLVGDVRNGFGMHTADVVPVNNADEWIENALKSELERNGFKITTSQNTASVMEYPVLSGDIQHIYCSAFFTYNAIITIDFRFTNRDKVLLDKRYNGKDEETLNMAATSSGYENSLSMALYQAVIKLVEDIKNIPMEN